MSDASLFSLLPVVAVALLLFFSTLLYGKGAWGLAAYSLAVALWAGALSLAALGSTAAVGCRLVAVGAFVPAAYLHAAFDITEQARRALLVLVYAVAAGIAALGLAVPGLLHDPLTLRPGPAFLPALAIAAVAAAMPAAQLAFPYRRRSPEARRDLRVLAAAGALGFGGAALHTFITASGSTMPLGLFVVLSSLLILARLVRSRQSAPTRRILERSLTYSVVAAFVSAAFLLGVFAAIRLSGRPLPLGFGLSALFLLFMAALAFEPLRQHLQEAIAKRLSRSASNVTELAEALVDQEERADHAGRLAELGALTSAVAHEVRNPLGVLAAQVRVLERDGVDPESLASMREQIARAETFVGDLLRYGRPRPLEIRSVDLEALVDLAWSTAASSLGAAEADVVFEKVGMEPQVSIEVDQAQMLEVLVVLFENALIELRGSAGGRIRACCDAGRDRLTLSVEDSGRGVPAEIRERVFEPFVTGRSRGGPSGGTGLGLAIARAIVERHGGAMRLAEAGAGGARFEVDLPLVQKVMGAAKGVE